MKIASPFAYEGELVLVEAELCGPRGTALRRLVLDTGAAATTLLPEVLDELGYSARDGDKRTKVHSAIGEEHGYSLNVAEFSALGVTRRTSWSTCSSSITKVRRVLGMNFLRHFNFEVRPDDRQIIVELISDDWSPIVDEQ